MFSFCIGLGIPSVAASGDKPPCDFAVTLSAPEVSQNEIKKRKRGNAENE